MFVSVVLRKVFIASQMVVIVVWIAVMTVVVTVVFTAFQPVVKLV